MHRLRRWLRRHDPEGYAQHRAIRLALSATVVLAVAHGLIDDPQVVTFGVFGTFALLLFADFPGSPAGRLGAYTGLVVVGSRAHLPRHPRLALLVDGDARHAGRRHARGVRGDDLRGDRVGAQRHPAALRPPGHRAERPRRDRSAAARLGPRRGRLHPGGAAAVAAPRARPAAQRVGAACAGRSARGSCDVRRHGRGRRRVRRPAACAARAPRTGRSRSPRAAGCSCGSPTSSSGCTSWSARPTRRTTGWPPWTRQVVRACATRPRRLR